MHGIALHLFCVELCGVQREHGNMSELSYRSSLRESGYKGQRKAQPQKQILS